MLSVFSLVVLPGRPVFGPPGIFRAALILAGYVASSLARVSRGSRSLRSLVHYSKGYSGSS
jgi:hypothetical protein